MASEMMKLTALLTMAIVAVSGTGYQLDDAKLQERYDLISAIVGHGVPSNLHKPSVGGGYAQPTQFGGQPKFGFNKAPTQTSYGSNPWAPQQANPGYGSNPWAKQQTNTGYGSNPWAKKQTNTGYQGGFHNPYANAGGSNFASQLARQHLGGGGVVPAIFNNDNLYKKNDINYNNNDPVYIGGGATATKNPSDLYSQTGIKQTTGSIVPTSELRLNAHGGKIPTYNGNDAVGSTYTGQPGTLYQHLPGYTNPYFSKF